MQRKITAIVAAALVGGSLAASAAEAQTRRHHVKPSAAAARAQVPPRAPVTQRAPESPAVYEWGKYQGQDPDINVRLMLRRDVHN
jgi:hypothetical protein